MLTVALLINPVAGIGGRLAQKGSDRPELHAAARAAGAVGRGHARSARMLAALGEAAKHFRWLTWGGAMGADTLAAAGIEAEVLGLTGASSSADDTKRAARAFRASTVDLLVFAGGDGTARDILAEWGSEAPVLGIPSGVKMHSGVFATTPEAAAAVLAGLAQGGLIQSTLAEVRDLDEDALREGLVRPRFFGELKVPALGGFLQHTKESGRENETLVLADIVADVVERVRAEPGIYLLGPGSSLAAVKSALGMSPTLIGVDVFADGQTLIADANADQLESLVCERSGDRPVTLILSFTRQQGFLVGRGNLQLSPAVLRAVGRERLWILGTRSKLKSLEGRPLVLDTDDMVLDRAMSGLYEVICGYDDRLWYRVESGLGAA
ncbi:MAG: ATP-NAD kinase family protein [Pseudomonadales bacterium]